MDFVIGGLAGAGATVFTNPLDVVKTRMQLQGELRARNEHTVRYKGIAHALFVIGKTDGLPALQRGLAPAMLLGFIMNSVRLGLYHVAEVQGWTKNQNGEVVIKQAAFWSTSSGVMSAVVGNPLAVIKTRIHAAAHPSIAVGRQHTYKGTLDGCKKVFHSEGIRGFFSGINATCAKLAVGSCAQLTTFSTVKEALISRGVCESSPFGLAFLASSASGVAVAAAVCPIDVVAVRLYNQGRGNLYSGVLNCLMKTYYKEGLHGLYKGLGPLYVRIAPQTTLCLVIWDTLNNLLTNHS